jgi:hypothetical protein
MYPKSSVVDSYLLQKGSGSSSDPHQSNKLDPDPQHSDKLLTSQNVWNMRLFEHFFKVLSLYLEARCRIRIRIKETSRIRIRTNVIRIRNTCTGTVCKGFNLPARCRNTGRLVVRKNFAQKEQLRASKDL